MENPFNTFIDACGDDAAEIERGYAAHREQWNAQQKAKILSPNFPGMVLDTILQKLEDPTLEPGYQDPRHCITLWGRPPAHIKRLIAQIQAMLLDAAPNLWIMPQDRLHITSLEITHSRTKPEVDAIVDQMQPHLEKLVNYALEHRTRLHKPLLSIDSSGIALTFLPKPTLPSTKGQYTYHHFRRDLWDECKAVDADVVCRYIAPSSHLTVGRFIDASDFTKDDGSGEPDPTKIERWVAKIDEINAFLSRAEISGMPTLRLAGIGEWSVGEEVGLHYRHGALWYGGGESLAVGKGF